MKDTPRILIAGGDMRQISCAARLSKEFDISVMGFDETYTVGVFGAPEGKYDYLVLPVPPFNDKGDISTPCFSGALTAADTIPFLAPDAVIFAGHAGDSLKKHFGGFESADYLEREELCLKNAVPTAEGAVQIALEELPVTLNGLRVLIVGMGRIGMALSAILKGFGADVTAAVHNEKGAARARVCGVRAVKTDRVTGDYGLVFNTVPSLIFSRERLKAFGSDTLFIDLASKPGGIDFESAAELGIKTIWALGLPGKAAPVTAGEMIAETLCTMIGERSDTHG